MKPDHTARNAELRRRHRRGDSLGVLASAKGLSRERVRQIVGPPRPNLAQRRDAAVVRLAALAESAPDLTYGGVAELAQELWAAHTTIQKRAAALGARKVAGRFVLTNAQAAQIARELPARGRRMVRVKVAK